MHLFEAEGVRTATGISERSWLFSALIAEDQSVGDGDNARAPLAMLTCTQLTWNVNVARTFNLAVVFTLENFREEVDMSDRDLHGLSSTARIGGHPIHPMLVPFPIALLVATFVCDLVYWTSGNAFWAEAALWSLIAAIAMAALAAAAGLTDFLSNARIRAIGDAWKHMIGNMVAVVLALISLWFRYRYGAEEAVLPWGIVLSGLVVLLLLYTGWMGGNLVYHHRIGIHPEEPTDRGMDEAKAAWPRH